MSTFSTVNIPAYDWQFNLAVYPLRPAVRTVSINFETIILT